MRTLAVPDWVFVLADEPDAWAKGHDDSGWRTVRVPHDWSVGEDFAASHSSGTGYLPGGVGWYRAHVSLRGLDAREDQHVRLAFDGVYKDSGVWANGYRLGRRPSGYAPFSFDLTEILRYAPDDDLVISVRVDHTDISDSRWYNGSGITRGVRLEVHEQVRLREHGTSVTTSSADAASATLRIAQALVNDTSDPVVVRVRHELRSLASERVHEFETETALPAGGTGTAALDAVMPEPELWSDVDPSLHRLTTTLEWAGSGTEPRQRRATYDVVTGIRSFSFDPDRGFSINGEPRLLKGVCLHEDAGCLGTAVPPAVWLRRLLSLKEAGCNAIRMAHNPHAPELYTLCDALGFFVIDEAFDEWENPKNKWWQGHNVYPARHEGPAHDFAEWHERDLIAMVESHRNHPSIVAWSIGNEVDYPNDPYASPLFAEMTGNNDADKPAAERVYDPSRPDVRRLTTIGRRLGEIVRRADPSRPVTLAAAFPELSSRTGLLDDLDLVGYNYKEHLYADDHRRFPGKPFVGSENGHGYREWRRVLDDDFVAGQFLWTGIDYLGEAHGWPVHGSGAGLLTLAGFEKPMWHLRRSWWSGDPVAHLVTRPFAPGDKSFWSHPVSRSWDGGADGAAEVLCFAAGGEPRLTCGGDELPLERDDEHGYWTARATPSGEPLVLEVRRDGDVVARDELSARGAAATIDAVPWRAPDDALRRCRAAGLQVDDVLQIECTLRDANGGVADDERIVDVHVAGGALLGIENGDLGDVTPYARTCRRTRDGRLIVFVRTSGAASVQVTAPGLPASMVEE